MRRCIGNLTHDKRGCLCLQDVIQQMLSVQPELLADQAAPPAPAVVIDNLPTVTLNQQMIGTMLEISVLKLLSDLS